MKKRLLLVLAISGVFSSTVQAFTQTWRPVASAQAPLAGRQVIVPEKYLNFELNDGYMKDYLFSLSGNPNANHQVDLPAPDGSIRTFVIWKSDMMAPALEAKYPGIRTFTAYALDNPRIVAKIDYTLKGFHAMVFDGGNTYFIDPYTNVNDGNYICYYKHDFVKPEQERMICQWNEESDVAITEDEHMQIGGNETVLPNVDLKVLNGHQKRQYRLALACTYEYSVAVDGPVPTKPGVLSAMVTSVNRVNGVYELEMAITMQLVGNTDTLIWLTSSDPYTNNNGGTMLGQNQTQVNNRIGSANYDIGHVFSTGGGGIASLGSICGNSKAQGVTGSSNPVGDAFDIDYVAHEMGHQFGGPHTFNNNSSGSCSGNRSGSNAYEPGSGSTIMAYAGICPSDNLQQNSDAYFHSNTIQRIYNTITQTSKNNCPTKTNTGNAPSGLADYNATYYIPFLTPFELEAPLATDSAATDTLTTYCWEQFDLGAASTWANQSATGPIFRSFNPTTSRTRVFPAINRLVNNVTNYLGEKLPPEARTLKFLVTTRSIYQGLGCINFSDDTVKLNVINTTTPFAVTVPNTNVTWQGGSTQNVTWNVSNTTAAPISCANVNVFLSVDGGYTYPYTVAMGLPNNGSANIIVPNVPTTSQARIKVKGAGNVFFDISNVNFTINYNSSLPQTPPASVAQAVAKADVKIFPVPASDVLNIAHEGNGTMKVSVFNTVGQSVYTGTLQSELQLDVKGWAKGIYYLHFVSENGERFSKPVVIQ